MLESFSPASCAQLRIAQRPLPLGRLSPGRKRVRWKQLPRPRAWALPGLLSPLYYSPKTSRSLQPLERFRKAEISPWHSPASRQYTRTGSWAREQPARSPGAQARAETRPYVLECKPRAPPSPGSAHFEQDLVKFPRGSARVERDAGSYRRLLVPDSGRGSAPEVEGRSPPSSRPVLHPREAAQPERRRGAHPPGHRDALCVPSFSLRREGEGGDRD